jgi:hypothetical protein
MFLELFARLHSRGHELRVLPLTIEETWQGKKHRLPGIIRDSFIERCKRGLPLDCDVEITMAPQGWKQLPNTPDRSFLLTMFESTRISPAQVAVINRFRGLIVPNRMNVEAAAASGVTVPFHIMPLGINPDVYWSDKYDLSAFEKMPLLSKLLRLATCVSPEKAFRLGMPPKKERIIFGTAGLLTHSANRKNIDGAMLGFVGAFHWMEDVRLQVKCFPNDPVPTGHDSRIEFIRELWPTHKLVQWYRSLDAFIVTAKGEGWGLMAHQAMACGVPVVGPMFGGLAEFLTAENGYPVYAPLVPDGTENAGHDVIVDLPSLIEQLRRIYFDRVELHQKSVRSAWDAKQFTWERSADTLENILKSLKQ